MELTPELVGLRDSLLRNLRRPPGPEDGIEAFDCHILLAVRIHRAARLNARASDRDGQAWRRYFVDCFPEGRNSAADADFLWAKWRTGLLKDESPRGIAHGQSGAHWYPLPEGEFCVNLESMWDDFEYSVDRLVETLQADHARRKEVVRRGRERSWAIMSLPVVPSDRTFPSPTLYPGSIAVAAAPAVSAVGPTPTAMVDWATFGTGQQGEREADPPDSD